MNILAFDTALGACSVALYCGGEVVSCAFEERRRGHVERLFSMIDEVLAEADFDKATLDYIAVTRGPGAFAGVRIGLAAARGLALGLGIPLVGFTTLEAVAQAALDQKDVDALVVIHDARRGEVYFQCFEKQGKELLALEEPKAVPLSEIAGLIPAHIHHYVGTGVELVRPLLGEQLMALPLKGEPEASIVAIMAAARISPKISPRISQNDFAPVRPLYLRLPDAKLPSKAP